MIAIISHCLHQGCITHLRDYKYDMRVFVANAAYPADGLNRNFPYDGYECTTRWARVSRESSHVEVSCFLCYFVLSQQACTDRCF